MKLNPVHETYLGVEGKIHGAVSALNSLARLIGDREDEDSVGIAEMMFDQLDKVRAAQTELAKACDDAKRSAA